MQLYLLNGGSGCGQNPDVSVEKKDSWLISWSEPVDNSVDTVHNL